MNFQETLNLADALVAVGDVGQAAAAYFGLGNALQGAGELQQAAEAYRKAIALQPDHAEAHNNLGCALRRQSLCDPALAEFAKALALRPDYAAAHWNMGTVLLLQGDLPRGWMEYEWRWKVQEFSPPQLKFSRPRWEGEYLSGERVLLYAEQGFGDVIQFSRYLPLVAKRGARIVLACQPELRRLLEKNALPVAAWVNAGEKWPAYDLHCPLMSLGRVFKTTVADIPARPYLNADATLAEAWLKRLPADRRLKVGFIWANKPDPPDRCPAASAWAPLASVGNVWFCSLQKEKVSPPPAGIEVTDWTDELRDFNDTAALLRGLDLLITVDTAVAHLAGAMGKPAWVLLKFVPDWRWMLGRSDSPWYPSMRLFRQPTSGDWETPIAQIAQALRHAAGARGSNSL